MAKRVFFPMRRGGLAAVAAGLLMFPSSAWTQAGNACDLNQNGSVNIVDVQLAVNMALGLTPCTANVYGSGVCNIVVIQRVTNAALGTSCITGTGTSPHSVSLDWTASTSSNVTGYYIYRGTATGGPYTKLNPTPVAGVTYTDNNVVAGQTYYYVSTAVDGSNAESVYSNQATAVIPSADSDDVDPLMMSIH